jgi:glutathione reductase (NADPH)
VRVAELRAIKSACRSGGNFPNWPGSAEFGRRNRLVHRAADQRKRLRLQDAGRGLGPRADEVVNLFGLAIRHEITADDLKGTMFTYPTGAPDVGYML